MATRYSTETKLPVLEDDMDIVDELKRVNDAFETYHNLISAHLLRISTNTDTTEECHRFLSGLNILFYSTLARSERVEKTIHGKLDV